VDLSGCQLILPREISHHAVGAACSGVGLLDQLISRCVLSGKAAGLSGLAGTPDALQLRQLLRHQGNLVVELLVRQGRRGGLRFALQPDFPGADDPVTMGTTPLIPLVILVSD
jgi:hypothetical protein